MVFFSFFQIATFRGSRSESVGKTPDKADSAGRGKTRVPGGKPRLAGHVALCHCAFPVSRSLLPRVTRVPERELDYGRFFDQAASAAEAAQPF